MKKTILLFTLTIFLVQTVSAFTFLNIYIDSNGQATFIGETSDPIPLPNGVNIQETNIVGKTQSLTNKQGEVWNFSYSLQGAEMNIILPKGAVIKSLSGGDISIINNKISIYETDSITVEYTIDESLISSQGNPNTVVAGIILLAVLIILIVFLVNYSKRDTDLANITAEKVEEKINKISKTKPTAKKPDKLKLIETVLSKREKLIISNLKKSGKIKQSQLRKLTEIPKASFSRHIQELEKKKLIKRTGEGKNKFVELIS